MSPEKKVLALKRVSLDGADESTIAGYVNEIALLNRLAGHENIIRLIESQVLYNESVIYLVMECGEIDLARLFQRQQGKPLNLNFVRFYWQQMLEAVHAIHEQRIVHSDLKPANFIFVQGTLKLIDFGIAKAIGNDTTNIIRDNQVGISKQGGTVAF